ncbi:hypothetical protein FACS189485_22850 [Spirochaetia bacterium]|nr:hypothetical protein FACS189485_22850 [Spirochaetia bacterium]
MQKIVSIILISLILGSCQTTTKVNITTNVPDAKVTVDGKPLGNTPISSVKIKNNSGKTYSVVVEKEGYETLQTRLHTETKNANVAGLVVGYSLCWLIIPALLLLNGLWLDGPVEDQYFVLKEAAN